MKNANKIFIIRNIITSLSVAGFLTFAFFQNNLWGKIIISPFLICSISSFGQNTSLLFNKEKIANIFKYIFRISFFIYVFGFLAFMIYYAFANNSYLILIWVAVFIPFVIHFFKKAFFNKTKL